MATKRQNQIRKLLDVVHGNGFEKIEFFDREQRKSRRRWDVGRTGRLKNTICLCLFKILESLEGTIYIDDVDINQIGLDILRKNLMIIQQDPFLMEGSLKYNIDPFNKSER